MPEATRVSKHFAIGLAMFAAGICRAGEPLTIDAVNYFRVETVDPVRLYFQNSLLARACSHRYPKLCPVRPVSEKAYDAAIAGFRLVTGDMLNDLQPPKHLGSLEETASRMGSLVGQLEQVMPEHERRLYARIEALNRVCPDDKGEKRHRVIEMNIDANFVRFWHQPEPIYRRTEETFNEEASAFEQTIRAEWSTERCVATLDLGRSVLSVMLEKNTPFVIDRSHSLPTSKLIGASGEQFVGISYVLEATLHPEIKDELEAMHPLIKKGLPPSQE